MADPTPPVAAVTTPGSAAEHATHDHPFVFSDVLMHHVRGYPAIEYVHGSPLLVLNLGGYAAKNFANLSHDRGFAAADGTAYLPWAGDLIAAGRAPAGADANGLAKAMALVDHHAVALPRGLSFFTQQTFFSTIALILLALTLLVFARRRPDQAKPANRVQHVIEAAVLFIRDQVVRPNFHHRADHGDSWVPYFAAVFLCLLAMNWFGLVPLFATATGSPGVTVAFALTTLGLMLGLGLYANGPAFFTRIVPVHFSFKPLDLIIWTLLFVLELAGLLIRPAALAIRLFANLFAGHSVLLAFSLLGLIVYAANPDQVGLAASMGVFGWVLCVCIFFLEALIGFLQAYVFVILSAAFISQCEHPDH